MKNKLTLQVEALSVEAFATGPDGRALLRGTVQANAESDECQVVTTGTFLETRHTHCTLPPTLACPMTEYVDCL